LEVFGGSAVTLLEEQAAVRGLSVQWRLLEHRKGGSGSVVDAFVMQVGLVGEWVEAVDGGREPAAFRDGTGEAGSVP